MKTFLKINLVLSLFFILNIKAQDAILDSEWASLNPAFKKTLLVFDSSEAGYKSKLYTPLMVAIIRGKDNIVQELINSEDLNSKDIAGGTVLMLSIQYNRDKIFEDLLKHNVHLNVINKFGKSALSLLIDREDNPKKVNLLLDAGANINITDNDHRTPLMLAILVGKKEIAKSLIEHSADLNIKDKFGFDALDMAEHRGWGDIVRLIKSKFFGSSGQAPN